jgi:hypothetical protein
MALPGTVGRTIDESVLVAAEIDKSSCPRVRMAGAGVLPANLLRPGGFLVVHRMAGTLQNRDGADCGPSSSKDVEATRGGSARRRRWAR